MTGEERETHVEEEEALRPHNLVDLVVLGRRWRAQRVLAGFDRAEDYCNLLRARYGVDVSPRTIYAIERGEQMPHVDLFLASAHLLGAPFSYFMPAIRHDVAREIAEMSGAKT